MPEKLSPRPWMVAPETRAVLAALNDGGAAARFVGGCVRDALLDRAVKDIDIATPEPPDAVMRRLKVAGLRAVPTGIKHGTVTAVLGADRFEITTLRRDVETYGRHAKVAFTDDWEADAARRDFTINAMFCAPDGTLYDPFGGYDDLLEGRVRFVGDPMERLREDVLRLLRFYRFTAYYGNLPPDEAGRAACRALADLLRGLSAERVRDETLKLLAAPDPAAIFEVMAEDGVLPHFLPEARMPGRLRGLARLERRRARPDPLRRLAALLEVDEPGARGVARRLRLSNAQMERLAGMFALLPGFRPGGTAGARRRWLHAHGTERFRDVALLHWAERPRSASAAYCAGLAEAAAWRPVSLPVGGADVMALGVPAGPAVGRVLRAVEAWWIEGDFRATRPEALNKIRSMVKESRTARSGA